MSFFVFYLLINKVCIDVTLLIFDFDFFPARQDVNKTWKMKQNKTKRVKKWVRTKLSKIRGPLVVHLVQPEGFNKLFT